MELKEKKAWKCEAEGRRCARAGEFYLEKQQKNAGWNSFKDGFFAVKPKQPQRKRTSYKKKYAWTGKLFVHKNKHNNFHVSS